MILIIGGRWQGKLDYARERFGLADGDIQVCSGDSAELDLGRRCLAYIDRWTLGCVRRGEDPARILSGQIARLSDKVIISTDISCGVVPVDAQMRAWRDACGRVNALLAGHADEVWRLFCGLPQRIK